MDYDRFLSRVAITFRGRGTFEKVALLEALLQRYISGPPLDIGCSARRSRFHQPGGWGGAGYYQRQARCLSPEQAWRLVSQLVASQIFPTLERGRNVAVVPDAIAERATGECV